MEEHRGRWTCVITLKGELHWPTTSDMPSCCCPSTSLVTVQCTSCHSSRPWWWFKNEEGDWDDWGLSAIQRCLPELWRICLPLIWYTFNYQLYNSSGSTWVKFQQQVKKKKEKNFVKWCEPHMLKISTFIHRTVFLSLPLHISPLLDELCSPQHSRILEDR